MTLPEPANTSSANQDPNFAQTRTAAPGGDFRMPPETGSNQQPHSPQLPPAKTNSKAITSLVLGILGIIACPLALSIPAIYYSKQAKEELAYNPYEKGETEAQIGYILGIVGTVLGALVVPLLILSIILPFVFIGFSLPFLTP